MIAEARDLGPEFCLYMLVMDEPVFRGATAPGADDLDIGYPDIADSIRRELALKTVISKTVPADCGG